MGTRPGSHTPTPLARAPFPIKAWQQQQQHPLPRVTKIARLPQVSRVHGVAARELQSPTCGSSSMRRRGAKCPTLGLRLVQPQTVGIWGGAACGRVASDQFAQRMIGFPASHSCSVSDCAELVQIHVGPKGSIASPDAVKHIKYLTEVFGAQVLNVWPEDSMTAGKPIVHATLLLSNGLVYIFDAST